MANCSTYREAIPPSHKRGAIKPLLAFRVRASEHRAIQMAASHVGLRTAQFIRDAVNKEARRVLAIDAIAEIEKT